MESFSLGVPIQGPAGLGHGQVPVGGAGEAQGDVGGVGGDAGGHHPVDDVFHLRQFQVFGGGDVAQEGGAQGGGQGPADGPGDVVVTRSHVGDQGPQDVKGGVGAIFLLEADVFLNGVQGQVARPFHHHLDALGPGPLGELPQDFQFMELGLIGGVGQTAGAQAVPQGEGDVISSLAISRS